MLKSIVNSISAEQEDANIWIGSKYEKINDLKNDYVGRTGEQFLDVFCDKHDIDHKYNKDKIEEDGTFDIMIMDKKIEVKTSRLGKTGTFQHENLRLDEDCNYYIFLDISPNKFMISVIDKENFPLDKRHPIFEVTPHRRRETSNTYKFDLRESTSLKKGIEAGITFVVNDEDEDDEELKNFLIKSIV